MSTPQDTPIGPTNIPRTPNRPPRRRSNANAPTYIPIEGNLSSSPASFARTIARSVSPSRSMRDYFSGPSQGGSSWLSAGDPRREEWTVFGQLLENDRTPGMRAPSPSQLRTSPARLTRSSVVSTGSTLTTPSEPSRISDLVAVAEDIDPTPHASPRPTTYEEPAQLPLEQSRVSSHLDYDSELSDDESFVSTVPSTGEYPSEYSGDKPPLTEFVVVRRSGIYAPPSAYERATAWIPTLTPLQKNILKCAIAYFIGSLFTFVPALADLVSDLVPLNSNEGPSPSGHMVATVM